VAAGAAATLALALLTLSCPTRPTQGEKVLQLGFQFVDSLRLPGTAVGFCADRDGLLALDQAGTVIYRCDFDLKPGAAMALNSRMPGLRGMAADPFFIFFYDGSQVFRMDRSNAEVTLVTSGVDCRGAAVLSDGELAISDRTSGRVLLLGSTGNVAVLNDERPDFQPGALAAGRDGNVYVLNDAQRELAVFSRIGEQLRSYSLPDACARVAVDDSLDVYVMQRTGTAFWQVSARGRVASTDPAQLGAAFAATEFVVGGKWLFALDHGNCIRRYRLTATGD
jgi:hypothetical protein